MMQQHRVRITYEGALTEEEGDRLLDALERRAAGMGPVLGIELPDVFVVVLAVDAVDVQSALSRAAGATTGALRDAGITVGRPVGAEVELVDGRAAGVAS
jgi:hypothetical protein